MRSPIPLASLACVVILLSVLTLSAGGCGAGAEHPTTTSVPEPAPPAPISYSVSGGYPPFAERVEIDADGKARIMTNSIEKPASRVRTLTIREAELWSIREDLVAADFGSLVEPESSCADCVVYAISYAGESFRGDTITTPPELMAVIRRLDRLTSS